MYWLSIIFLFFFQPLDNAEQERMAALMVRVNQKVTFQARPLVKAIYREAKRKNLDPTVLAAIVWNESWYDSTATGSSHETGYWQVWPWASPSLDESWEALRKMKAIGTFPDVPWKMLSLKNRQRAARDIDIGTYMAVDLIAYMRRWCLAKKHDRRRPTDSYAHYNSGFRRPRVGYAVKLWHRTKLIRRLIGRDQHTSSDVAWINRVSITG